MSWGYFIDLNITLSSAAWKKISAQKLGAAKLPKGWSGLDDASLEGALGRPFSESDSIIKVLKGKAFHGKETVHRVEDKRDATSVRICLLLDKSTLELAYPLARLFQAARQVDGAKGSLRIINDGSAPGENGVVLSLAKKKVEAAPIEDCFAVAEQLTAELYGDLVSAPLKQSSRRTVS